MNRHSRANAVTLVALCLAVTGPAAAAIIGGAVTPPFIGGGVETIAPGGDIVDAFNGVGERFSYCSQQAFAAFPETAFLCALLTFQTSPQPSMMASLMAFPFDFTGLTDNATESKAGGTLEYAYAVVGPPTTRTIPLILRT